MKLNLNKASLPSPPLTVRFVAVYFNHQSTPNQAPYRAHTNPLQHTQHNPPCLSKRPLIYPIGIFVKMKTKFVEFHLIILSESYPSYIHRARAQARAHMNASLEKHKQTILLAKLKNHHSKCLDTFLWFSILKEEKQNER